MQPRRHGAAPAAPERPAVTENDPEYVLSEVRNARLAEALEKLADLAPSLKEAELRVLTELTRRFAGGNHASGRISSRTLADATKLARPNCQKALDSLAERHYIATRAGTATRPAAHALTYLRVTRMGGFGTMPPPVEIQASEECHPGSVTEPPPALFQSQGGIVKEPPPGDEEQVQGHPRARVDSDSISIENIDRLFQANPANCDPAEMRELSRWVHGYSLKFGKDHQGKPAHPHPPDQQILAQLLAIAPCTRIIAMIQALMTERQQPGTSYSWYVTVAAQRILGIKPADLKARRAELRVVRRPASPPAPSAGGIERDAAAMRQPGNAEFLQEIRSMMAAAGKKL